MAAQKDARQNYHLQFVATPTADTPGTMAMLHFDNKRYMFGQMAEGTQRACVQRGIGVKKVRNIFLTGRDYWEDNGGLIGFMLTLADQQLQEVEADGSGSRPRLSIHGGPKLLHSVACARRFVFRTGVPLAIHESTGKPFHWPSEPSFTDDNIRVWPLAIPGSDPSTTVNDQNATAIQHEQAARHKIVSDMFDSEWRRDRLIETLFREVTMPATVWKRDPNTKDLKGFHCASMGDAPELAPDEIVLVRNPWPASLVGQLPDASNLPSGVAMSYIVRGHYQRGSFDKTKAQELGVPNGPVRGKLTNGESITLADGRVITPEMVLGPGKEGKGIAFFDLPTMAHLKHLRSLVESDPSMLHNVALAIWTLGRTLGSSPDFRALIETLQDVDHLSSDPDAAANILALESVAASSIRLSDVSSTVFPVPGHDNLRPYHDPMIQGLEDGKQADNSDIQPQQALVPAAKAGLRINLEPTYSHDATEVPTPMTSDSAEKATSMDYLAAMNALGSEPILSSCALDEPEIVTLGTGSALPSKYRNVSATLLRMPDNQGNYLFDCGENTLGQLRRIFTYSELQDVLVNLKAIWISHLHADHHLGTISVLQARAAAFDQHAPEAERTIYLMSEQNKLDFIRDYSSVEPSLIRKTGMVPLVCSPETGSTLDGETFNFFSQDSAIEKVQTVRVSHCWGAQAISITFRSGFKISYSGDCRPSNSFCHIGRDSDVLIHEATFDDGMEGDARAKKHSTTSEALGIALKMRAKNVVLTHFSQRYQKVPNLDNVKLPNEIQFEEVSGKDASGPIDDGAVDAVPSSDDPAARSEMVSDDIMDRQSAMSFNNDFMEDEALHTSHNGPSTEKDKRPPSPLTANNEAAHNRRQNSAAESMAVCVAFDYMRVRVSQIKECKKLYPAIQAMFNEMEQRSEERRAVQKVRNDELANAKKHKKSKKQQEDGTGKKKAKTRGEHSISSEGGTVAESAQAPIGNLPAHVIVDTSKVEQPQFNQQI